MKRNISTRFYHISAPNHLLDIIEKETARMQRCHPDIQGFKITAALSNSRHRHGNQIRAQVSVNLRHSTLVATKEVEGMSERENAVVALGRAFDAVANEVEHFYHRERFRQKRFVRPGQDRCLPKTRVS